MLVGIQFRIFAEAHCAWEPQECTSDLPKRSSYSFSPRRVSKAFRSSALTEHFAALTELFAWAPQPLMPQHLTSPCFSWAPPFAAPRSPTPTPATAATSNRLSRPFMVILLWARERFYRKR